MGSGYEALRRGAAWIDLSSRGRIRVTGDDRARLLHAMVSNHVQQLEPGQGCYAFFLNAQGRILADAVILSLPDHFLLDTEPESRLFVLEHLDKYIIADDVTLEDATDATACIGVEGPDAAAALVAGGAPVPEAPYAHAEGGRGRVAAAAATGAQGFRIYAPQEDREVLIRELNTAGAVAASADEARTVRIELGKPRFPDDLADRLPQEAQVLSGVHFNKGCYLGQEIVERVRSRGGVHRFLVRLSIAGADAPAAGTRITSEGKQVGEITSAAALPGGAGIAALGYLRLDAIPAGASLEAAGARVEIAARAPLDQ